MSELLIEVEDSRQMDRAKRGLAFSALSVDGAPGDWWARINPKTREVEAQEVYKRTKYSQTLTWGKSRWELREVTFDGRQIIVSGAKLRTWTR